MSFSLGIRLTNSPKNAVLHGGEEIAIERLFLLLQIRTLPQQSLA
jgi:hypothetical protein